MQNFEKKILTRILRPVLKTGKQTKYWIWDNENFYCSHCCHVPGWNWLKTGVSTMGEWREKVLKLWEGTDNTCIQLYLAVDETISGTSIFFISRFLLHSHRPDFTNKC